MAAPFGLYGLIPTLSWPPPRPSSASASMATALWPLRPRLALTTSTALSRPPQAKAFGLNGPRLGLIWPPRPHLGLVWPQRPYPGLHGLVSASTASPFSPNGLIPASTALSRPPWPRSALMAPYGLHLFPAFKALVQASTATFGLYAAPFGPNGLILAFPDLIPASKASFGL
uniref:Uncharacterized protein n=1 Tax=Fagus sylvatica TaxID=28930 RepID=A0A2N9FDK0_FAGSY